MRRVLALVAAAGLAAVAVATTAHATSQSLTGISFSWSLDPMAGAGVPFGGCNFLSAGTAGDTGSSRLWTEADGFYQTTDGNVTVESPPRQALSPLRPGQRSAPARTASPP